MQVAPLTPPTGATPASAAEEPGSRAEQFARVLQNAFFGSGPKAVARGAEPAGPEAAPRSETRNHDLRSETVRPTERSNTRPSDYRDSAAQSAVQKKPVQQTSHAIAAGKPAEKPASPPPANQAEPPQSQETAAEPAPQVAEDAAPPAEDAVEDANEAVTAETAASDLLLILSLLQNQAAAPTETEAGQTALPGDQAPSTAPTAASTAEGQAAIPAAADAAIPALPAVAQPAAPVAGTTVPAAPGPVAPAAAEIPAALPEAAALAAKTTETSAAALLAQQQTVTPEEFAAIQQALVLHGQTKPATANAAGAKTEGKPADGKLSVEVQPAVSATAAKTLVDQSALLAMQGEDTVAPEAIPPQMQTLPQTAPQVQPQPLAPDAKFAAALQAQTDPAVLQTAAQPNSPAHLNQQVSPLSNPGTPAPQAAQQVASHAAARQLGAYIPAGEQVAVQIKKGVGEGLDKISIRLDPGGLGKVDVKMEVGHDGRLMAVISADKPETLAMLQRDAQNLEQSLRDAGLKTSSDSLSFTLRDQNQAAEGREGRDGQGTGRNRGRGHDEYAETGHAADPAALASANAQRAAAARGGLDIRI